MDTGQKGPCACACVMANFDGQPLVGERLHAHALLPKATPRRVVPQSISRRDARERANVAGKFHPPLNALCQMSPVQINAPLARPHLVAALLCYFDVEASLVSFLRPSSFILDKVYSHLPMHVRKPRADNISVPYFLTGATTIKS